MFDENEGRKRTLLSLEEKRQEVEQEFQKIEEPSQREILLLKIQRYNELIEEEFERLLTNISSTDETIRSKKNELESLANNINNVKILLVRVKRILVLLDDIEKLLVSAKKFSIWDIISGGVFSDSIKNGKLNQAQKMIDTLNQRIGEFQKESERIQVDTDLKVKNDGFLKFSDYVFDDIFSAFRIKRKIDFALLRIIRAKETFQDVSNKLSENYKNFELELKERKEKLYIEILEEEK